MGVNRNSAGFVAARLFCRAEAEPADIRHLHCGLHNRPAAVVQPLCIPARAEPFCDGGNLLRAGTHCHPAVTPQDCDAAG